MTDIRAVIETLINIGESIDFDDLILDARMRNAMWEAYPVGAKQAKY